MNTATIWLFLALYTAVGHADVPAHSDIALPTPDFAKTELGAPREPPHRFNPMLWSIPIGVVLLLGTMVVIRRQQ